MLIKTWPCPSWEKPNSPTSSPSGAIAVFRTVCSRKASEKEKRSCLKTVCALRKDHVEKTHRAETVFVVPCTTPVARKKEPEQKKEMADPGLRRRLRTRSRPLIPAGRLYQPEGQRNMSCRPFSRRSSPERVYRPPRRFAYSLPSC